MLTSLKARANVKRNVLTVDTAAGVLPAYIQNVDKYRQYTRERTKVPSNFHRRESRAGEREIETPVTSVTGKNFAVKSQDNISQDIARIDIMDFYNEPSLLTIVV